MTEPRDDIDELVDWQLEKGRRSGLYPPPGDRPAGRVNQLSRWAALTDHLAAIFEGRRR